MISEFPSVCSMIYQRKSEHRVEPGRIKINANLLRASRESRKNFEQNFHRKLAHARILIRRDISCRCLRKLTVRAFLVGLDHKL